MKIKNAIIILAIIGMMIFSVIGAGTLQVLNHNTKESVDTVALFNEDTEISGENSHKITENPSKISQQSIERDDSVVLIDQNFEQPGWQWNNPPTGWTTTTYFYFNSLYGYPHGGDQWAYSFSETDSMVSPTVTFGIDTELSFWYAAESSGFPQNLEVYLDGKTDGTLIWSHYGFNHKADPSLPQSGYLKATVDLSTYNGDHHIEFWNAGPTGLYGHLVDDVQVTSIIINMVPPTIENINVFPNPQIIDNSVNISCNITDDISVNQAKVHIIYPDSSIKNLSLIQIDNTDTYYFEQTYEQLGEHEFYIWANDTSNNNAVSNTYTFLIIDDQDLPDIEVNKAVWNGTAWAKYAIVNEGDIVQFQVSIYNPFDTYQIEFSGVIFDQFPCHLTYIENSSTITFMTLDSPSDHCTNHGEKIDWGNNTVYWYKPTPIDPNQYKIFTYEAIANCECDITIGSNNVTVSPTMIINPFDEEDIIFNNQHSDWNEHPEWWVYRNSSLNVSDSTTVEVICGEQPDLSVTKYVKVDCSGSYSDEGVFVGLDDPRWVTFKIVVVGDGVFDEVVVVDTLPYGLVFDGMVTGPSPTGVSGNVFTWDLGGKSGVWSVVLEFKATIAEVAVFVVEDFCGNVTNMVSVTGMYGDNDIVVSDSAWVDIECPPDDDHGIIIVNKMVKPDCQDHLYNKILSFDYGDYDDITFRLEIYTNRSLISLSVRDTLPQLQGLEFKATYIKDVFGNFVDESEYTFTMTDTYIYWNFTYLDSETRYYIYYCANVTGCGFFENFIHVEGFYYNNGPCCPIWLFSEDSAIVNVTCPSGLSVKKEASFDGVSWYNDGVDGIIGDTVWFRITIENHNFDSPVYAVNVTDILPDHLAFESFVSTDGGSVINGVGWWQVFYSFIDSLDTKVILFKANVVNVGNHPNVVVATSCGEQGIEDDVWVNVSHGMNIRKTVSTDKKTWVENLSVINGQRVWWNVSIHFAAVDQNISLVDIVLKDWLPDGVKYVVGSGKILKHTGWSLMREPVINGRLLTWDLSMIPECYLKNGGWLSVTFATDVVAGVTGTLVNWGNVTARQCDGTNLFAKDNATIVVSSLGQMSCEKLVRKSTADNWVDEIDAEVGDTVSFNVSIRNLGHMPMYKIGIWDILPSNLEYKQGTAKVLFNGSYTNCEPDELNGNILFWDDICLCIPSDFDGATGRYLMPGEIASVIFDVKIISIGIAINRADINATMCNQGIPMQCWDTATVNILIPSLVADAGGPYIAFIGDSVELKGSASGGVGPYTYYWDLDNDGQYNDGTGSTVEKTWSTKGTYTIGIKVIDTRDINDTDTALVTIKERIPDLQCYGGLHWINISPGDTINGEFTIRNNGDPGSKLDWEITSTPDWGSWSFSPSIGTDLTPENGAKVIQVTVTVPRSRNEQFYGNITVINSENPLDSCQIQITLATPRPWNSHPFLDFIQQFIQRFTGLRGIWENMVSRITVY